MAKAAVTEPRRTLLVHLVSLGAMCLSLNLQAQTSGVLREVYAGINGGAVSDLTNSVKFPNSPDESFLESAFEAPSNFSDFYGQRMRALLLPPVTGTYVFWLATDDGGALFLSSDESPAHKVQVASESSWVGQRQWNLHASQKSAPVQLTNGYRYYIEALQKEGAGGDNLAVTWQRPGDPAPADGAAPIPGNYLIPYGVGPPIITVQPANQTVIESMTATFSIELAQKFGAVFQWYRGLSPLPNATNDSLTLPPVGISDSGSTYYCRVVNPYGGTNSNSATLTVSPDTTRPTLSAIGNLGDPQLLTLIFSEPVEAASATDTANYRISGGVTILSAAFIADTRTIILTTTPMAAQTTYTLTINNVRDRAVTPNTILPNTQKTFSLDSTPLDVSFVKPAAEPIGPSSRRGPLVISEIMYHPEARTDGKNLEFLEIYNSNPYSEDISRFRISGEVDFTFPSNTLLGARSVVVLAANPVDMQSLYGTGRIVGPYTNRLSNGAGTLRLHNREGGIVFEVKYSGEAPWPASADGGGHSLVLARPSLGERNPSAWSASDTIGGSPGWIEAQGNNPYRTVLINEFLAHTDLPDLDFIELYNYSSNSFDISGCVLTEDPATNKFVFPSGTTIQARGFLSLNENELGFRLNAGGETIYLKDPSNTRVIDAVRFTGQQNGVSTGRTPDGAAKFSRLETKTPGSSNARERAPRVVINEIMYDPVTGDEDYQFVELHNCTGAPLDLGRWRLEDGIEYTFPIGTVLPASGYLVVAKNATVLMTNYPVLSGANTLGNFSGALARSGDRIALSMPDEVVSTNILGTRVTNTIHIVVDEVTYGTGGRWGRWSHGGGSSLELIDWRSERRLAPNWADSDETAKSPWTTIEFTGVLDNGNGNADSLQIIALGAGEYLVDSVEIYAAGGQNLVSNPNFDAGLAGWVPQGNHEDSTWETGTGFNGSPCLHVRATDHGDTGANRIRTSLTSTLNAGQTATIRARVRWLKGAPELLLRLRGNWLEATGPALKVASLGTPGAANTRWRPNTGPAITGVTTSPVLPAANQAVTVVARASDPDGLASLLLHYRIDPGTNFTPIAMVNNGAGLFSATIPGQAAATLAAFHIQAFDGFTPRGFAQFPENAPDAECLVRWGDPAQSGLFGTYRVWMTQATLDRWSKREALSNKPLDCTFVYGSSRTIYNIGGQYSGSPWHSPGFNSPIGNVCDYLLNFPGDDRLLGDTDATLQWPGNGGGDNTYQREQTAYWMAEQMGLPYCHRRSVNLFMNGVRRAQLFEDVQQPGGDLVDEFFPAGERGDLHKIQVWFEFDDAATTFSAAGATLQNVTTTGGQKKLARYRWTFAKRSIQGSANNYTNLFALVDAANYGALGASYRNQLEATIDIDNWLKTYAVEHAVGNVDSFAYGGGQNMYAYKPPGDTWKMFIWDIDFAFVVQGPESDMFQGIGRSNGIDLGEPAYQRRYLQILEDLANGPLTAARFDALVDSKYNAMVASGRSVENPAGLKTYASQRRSNLLSLLSTNGNATFAVYGGSGYSTPRNYVNLSGTAPFYIRTITINGVPIPVTWITVSNWTALVALGEGVNNLSIQGWTASGMLSTNATINITNTATAELPKGKIVFNEIMYHPARERASFVELFSSSSWTAFDLSGWRISGLDFVFPGGTVLLPNAHLLVAGNRVGFADAYGKTLTVAGEFSGTLDNNGETLRLIMPGATPELDVVVDEVRYGNTAPWPIAADGAGSSLQAIDWHQDTWRVANWAAVPPGTNLSKATPGGVNNVTRSMEPFPPLWINEFQASNLNDITNSAGMRVPWIEIYNPSSSTVSLARLHLAASYTNLLQWSFPSNATIAPGQFKVVFADGLTNLGTLDELHASFTLPTPAGQLALTRLGTNGMVEVLDYVNYSGVPPGRSYGSLPDGQSFRRQRFFIPTPGGTNNGTSTPLNVVVNEWMASNSTTIADPSDNDFEDWFELYNYGDTTADLSGFYLGTSLTNKTEFLIPDGYTIPPGGYLVVWADNEPSQNKANEPDLHTNFKLDKDGDAVGVFAPDGTVIDFVSFSLQQQNASEGRFPDGSAFISRLTTPTPRGSNWLSLPNSPPLIAAVTNQSLVAGQLLLYTISATDTNVPAQQLTFSLDPGAPSGASIDPVTGLFTWRPSVDQVPGPYRFDIRVTDDGLPPMSATTSFVVQVGQPPKVFSMNRSPDGAWSLTFNTIPTKTYRLEFKDSLRDSEWQPLDAGQVAIGESLTISDPAPPPGQRFYRITVF